MHVFDLKTGKKKLARGVNVQRGWLNHRHWTDKYKFDRSFGAGVYKATFGYYRANTGIYQWTMSESELPKGWTPGRKWREKFSFQKKTSGNV